MKVGSLVKVYHYSHNARERLARIGNSDRFVNVDAHFIGLIVATGDGDPRYRRVLRSVDGEWEYYNVLVDGKTYRMNLLRLRLISSCDIS